MEGLKCGLSGLNHGSGQSSKPVSSTVQPWLASNSMQAGSHGFGMDFQKKSSIWLWNLCLQLTKKGFVRSMFQLLHLAKTLEWTNWKMALTSIMIQELEWPVLALNALSMDQGLICDSEITFAETLKLYLKFTY